MPLASKKVHVIKVPNEQRTSTLENQKVLPHFDRMPRMYLELLENKEKVKPHLVNKEYDPDDATSVYSFDLNPPPLQKASFQPNQSVIQEEFDDDDETISNASGMDRDKNQEDEDETLSTSETGTSISRVSSTRENDDQSESTANSFIPKEEKMFQEDDTHSVVSSQSSASSVPSRRSISRSVALSSKEQEIKNKTKQKLKDLLFSEDPSKDVPTLAELKRRGEVKDSRTVADFGRGYSNEARDEEDELKRELLFKFELLKKSYKHVHVPEFSMHSDYRNMNQTYENTLRQVSLDSNVESYKSLLVGGCMLLEFILGHWLKFDMSGFTQQQILNMNQYERLLIELGEKSYVPGGSQWPVEIRLLGLLIMNAIIFIISKLIMKSTGSNLVGLMNSVNTAMNHNVQKPKRKMRGPSVDINAIPEVSEEDE